VAKVAVVRGGRSLEREISLRSGHHVAAALRHLGHEPIELDVDERLTHALEDTEVVFIALQLEAVPDRWEVNQPHVPIRRSLL
jgi:D-alanine-D-alanine ligase